MRNLTSAFAAAFAALTFLPASASAAVITENLNFTLSGFVDISGASIAPPNAVVSGFISVTYDPALTYDNDTADLVVHSFSGTTVSSAFGFTYQSGFLEFGGIANDADLVYSNTNDIVVAFNVTNPLAPTFVPCSTLGYTCGVYTGSDLVDAAGYTLAGYQTGWFYGVPQSSVTTNPPSAPSAPEPATTALCGLGIATLAAAASRRVKRG
jgi:hypothetical protein